MISKTDYNINEEIKFFNAVNLAFDGDYTKIRNNYQKSWQNTWEKISSNYVKIDPQKELERLTRLNISLILKDAPEYPALLKEIAHPPFGLYVLGKINQEPKISIVGTRRASDHGSKIAVQLAQELINQEITIVSGLALGIDEATHWGAVKSSGKTIAVLARGLDEIYPYQNKNLADKIIEEGGAIISEYPLGSPPYPARFLERNRIVSGLSLATIIVEAPARSGALATANFAINQNREVFVIPGSINNKNYVGSNNLIKSGATLMTEIEDIFNNIPHLVKLPLSLAKNKNQKSSFFDADQKLIFEALEKVNQAVTVDRISELVKLSPQTVNSSLSLLVINNLVKEEGGRYYV